MSDNSKECEYKEDFANLSTVFFQTLILLLFRDTFSVKTIAMKIQKHIFLIFFLCIFFVPGTTSYGQDSENFYFEITQWQVTPLSGGPSRPLYFPESISDVFDRSIPVIYRTEINIQDILLHSHGVDPDNFEQELVFSPGRIDDADRTYLNGVLIGETGWSSDRPHYDIPRYYRIPPSLIPADGLLKFEIHVRPLFPGSGGLYKDVPVLAATNLAFSVSHMDLIQLTLSSIFVVIGIYFLFLFLRRKTGKEYLLFFITCLMYGLYFLMRTSFKFELAEIFSIAESSLLLILKRLEYAALFSLVPLTAHFMMLFFEEKRKLHLIPVYVTDMAALFSMLSLIFNDAVLWFDMLNNVMYPSALFSVLSVSATLYSRISNRDNPLRRDAFYMLALLLFLTLTAINDMAHVNNIIHTASISHIGFFGFVAGIGWLLSNRFVRLYDQIEDLNESLENRVQDRTAELKKALQRHDYEMNLASQIQKGILPESATIKGFRLHSFYQSMEMVGGDLFDILPAGRNTLIYMADASGHGVPAALITMMTKTAFINASRKTRNLEKILNIVNDELVTHVQTDDYVSCFALMLCPDGKIHYASAGHPSAIVKRKNRKVEFWNTDIGFFLGAFPGPLEFEVKTARIRTSESIHLYTDGISEVRNPENNTELGEDGLGNLIQNHDTNTSFSKIQTMCQHQNRDDASLLILEKEERPVTEWLATIGKMATRGRIQRSIQLMNAKYEEGKAHGFFAQRYLELLIRNRMYEKAWQRGKELIKIHNRPELFFLCGCAGARLDREPDLTDQFFESALKLNPDRKNFWFEYGLHLRRNGRFDDSYEALLKALKLMHQENSKSQDLCLTAHSV